MTGCGTERCRTRPGLRGARRRRGAPGLACRDPAVGNPRTGHRPGWSRMGIAMALGRAANDAHPVDNSVDNRGRLGDNQRIRAVVPGGRQSSRIAPGPVHHPATPGDLHQEGRCTPSTGPTTAVGFVCSRALLLIRAGDERLAVPPASKTGTGRGGGAARCGVPPRGPARECGREGSYGVRPELEHQPVGVSVRRTGRRRASAGVSGPARPRARHRRACDDSRLGRTARLVSSALSNRHSPLAQHHSAATAASQEVCR